jgi:hypothetical protein
MNSQQEVKQMIKKALEGKECQICQTQATGATQETRKTGTLNGQATFAPVIGSERYWCKGHFPRTVIDIRNEEELRKWVPCKILDVDGNEITEQIVRVKLENGEILCFELKDGSPFEDPERPGEVKTVTKFFKPPLRVVKQ